MSMLPPFVSLEMISARLNAAFPEGSEFRRYAVRLSVERTIFSMLYIGAIEGSGRLIQPKQIYEMSDKQAARSTDAARTDYAIQSAKKNYVPLGKGWYLTGSREPIRDEGIRHFLVTVGAATERQDKPKTSPTGRYALTKEFADLFRPDLGNDAFKKALAKWSRKHLAPGALARIELVKAGAGADPSGMTVEFPNKGGTRQLEAGISSVIAKGVIEDFSIRFLENPFVLWFSQSGSKVVKQDEVLAKRIGINIDQSKVLPDIILVDVGRTDIFIVFVEVVATDGPISDSRRKQLAALVTKYGEDHMAFVTAFADRDSKELRKLFGSLSWNSFAWLASEPEKIVGLFEIKDPAKRRIRSLAGLTHQQREESEGDDE